MKYYVDSKILESDKPLSLTKARLARVNGNVSRNFPPIANKTANKANNKIVISLTPFDIFFGEIFDHHLNKKYKMTKITSR